MIIWFGWCLWVSWRLRGGGGCWCLLGAWLASCCGGGRLSFGGAGIGSCVCMGRTLESTTSVLILLRFTLAITWIQGVKRRGVGRRRTVEL